MQYSAKVDAHGYESGRSEGAIDRNGRRKAGSSWRNHDSRALIEGPLPSQNLPGKKKGWVDMMNFESEKKIIMDPFDTSKKKKRHLP